MTLQDIYFGIQTGLQLLVGGSVVWGICWLGPVLKRAIESQEKTIAAQAEQMKAQSTVLQDFERLNQAMKLVLEVAGDPAALQREQAYKARVDRDATAMLNQQIQQLDQGQEALLDKIAELATGTTRDLVGFISRAMLFIPHAERMPLIEATALFDRSMASKNILNKLAQDAPYRPITNVARLVLVGQLAEAAPRQSSERSPMP